MESGDEVLNVAVFEQAFDPKGDCLVGFSQFFS